MRINKNRVKQIFVELAKALPPPGFRITSTDGRPGPIILTEPLAVHGNLILYGDIAIEYFNALEEINALVTIDPNWNKDAIETVVNQCLQEVAAASLEDRAVAVRTQSFNLIEALDRQPSTWQADLSVFGMALDCAGLRFGKIELVADKARSPISVPGLIEANTEIDVLLARIQVRAVDKGSAHERAREILEQHLLILNALCCKYHPSRTCLTHRQEQQRSIAFNRVRDLSAEQQGVGLEFKNKGILLLRHDCEEFIKSRGGESIANRLIEQGSFARRITGAYEIAGLACSEQRPHLSFLLFAIALESLILGTSNKTEISFQLGSRVAHLLCDAVPSRRATAKVVSNLYDLRSKVVHTGETEIGDSELRTIKNICLSSLYTLMVVPDFANMVAAEELENWFCDRLLGASSLADSVN